MSFNRNLWEKPSFDADSVPPWCCSRCNHPLKFEKERRQIVLSNDLPDAIVNISSQDIPDLAYLEYRFSGILLCDGCKLKTVISGYAHYLDKRRYPVSSNYFDKKQLRFYPIYFDPCLMLFSIPEECPAEIQRQLRNSFSHYWNDQSSCGNRLRSVLELLMDDADIPKKGSLHDRLKKFKKERNMQDGFLDAIKVVGNIGSHTGFLTRGDLLDCFELLEYVLIRIYPDGQKSVRLTSISKNIVLKKKS